MSETFILGGREFTCHPMNAFAANRILMRVQKVVLPIFGALAPTGGAKSSSLLDVDVKTAAQLVAEHVTDELFETVVFPMFADAKVYACEERRFIKAAVDVDVVFTRENLFDLYELIFLVGRYQFAPFFETLARRFGGLLGGEKTPA